MTTQPLYKLLIVDDDVQILRLVEKVLKRSLGDVISIESVSCVEDAINRIDRGDVELLVTDLEMPGVSGLELLKRAKQQKPCTQVVLMTGSCNSDALLDALEMGASDYLVKPVDFQMLDQLVCESVQRLARWKQAFRETWTKKRTTQRSLQQSNP